MLRPWSFHIDIDKRNRKYPVYRQIADKIRQLIVCGGLKPGEALPASRTLAASLQVSRKSVVCAMDVLLLSGLVENRERVGLFVASSIPLSAGAGVSQTGRVETGEPKVFRLKVDDGVPDTRIAPVKELSRTYRQLFNRAARHQLLGYSDPNGIPKFRTTVSSMLNQERGLDTHPDEICITRGSQMALFLIAHALLSPGESVLVENPCYERAANVFRQAGLNIIPIDVDSDGLCVDSIEAVLLRPDVLVKAIYVTPRHNYPTMVSLSMERKHRLSSLVIKHGLYLIEDDYDYDFQSKPSVPVSAFLPKENRLYIGTFSKIIAPSVRIGFLATSVSHAVAIGNLRGLIDIQGDSIMEHALCELVQSGDVKRHIRKSARYYEEKRIRMVRLLEVNLTGKITWLAPQGGLAIWIHFVNSLQKSKLEADLQIRKIALPLFDTPSGLGARIGYASLTNEEMIFLVETLRQIL